jgi:hypothetical protein
VRDLVAAFDRVDTRLRSILHFPLSEEPTAAEFGQGQEQTKNTEIPDSSGDIYLDKPPWLFAFRA